MELLLELNKRYTYADYLIWLDDKILDWMIFLSINRYLNKNEPR